ncbi:dTDP-glucose 4,6-dehydratase [Paenibacillus marchantiophytorum]|uniref:dTDP-glucose 4,6-dehydratase n=1 Tax=Paenibacillus marchantiophytorum TaxID=1619310 RepID=A0ABQ2BU45_9BACL|nr:GDP-mannose 4,6-dehydratase [Paenibacillus marchantiophytorum]GGI46256.1 dTDP-glucose 4,6-dehydratase [Paenibacillus marchantiophytorum]
MILLKALITGASGFVGKVLSQTMMEENIDVLGLSRSTGFTNNKENDQYKCDILDKFKLKEIISTYRPDYIVHLAGPAFIPDSFNRPQKTYEIIFNGTLNVLECVKELELDTKVLYVSSADVYGGNSKTFLTEDEHFDPRSPYSAAKACSELLCRQFTNSYGLNTVIARPFNHTGPGQSKDFVCSSFAHQIAAMEGEKEKKLHTGNIDVKRDFLDVRDVVNAYINLLTNGVSGETYNISSGKATSIRDIIDMLFKEASINEYDIIIDPLKVRDNDIPIRVGDSDKLRALSGWAPKYKIEQTIADIFHYWKEKSLHVDR